jgi:hypothetical protein
MHDLNFLHSQINHQENLLKEKELLIKSLKEQIEIKNKIIYLQDTKLF